MSDVRSLLVNNVAALEKPRKQIEIPRISKVVGEKFEVTIKAINMGQLKSAIRDLDVEDVAGSFEYGCLIARYGLEEPRVTDKKLQEDLGVPNWEELLNKIFLPGEIMNLSEEILQLSDFDGEAMKKKKAPATKKKKVEKVEEE